MGLKRGIVKLEDYDKKWKESYINEEKFLKQQLKDIIVEIHHVGSTSIEGIVAKPIIDILIVIKTFDEIKTIEKILKKYDYENRGHQGVETRYFFAKGSSENRTHYIHFVTPKNKTYYDLILFKKYLTEHPQERKQYCNLKQELAYKYPEERAKYTKGKNDYINKIIERAKKEYND